MPIIQNHPIHVSGTHDSNLTLLTGPNNCGKSLFAENLITSSCSSPLYVGTLPLEDRFKQRISAHRTRRSNNWGLIEGLKYNDKSWQQLEAKLQDADGVLVDGLSSLLWLQMRQHGLNSFQLEEYAHKFVFLIMNRSTVKHHVIVDCDIPFPANGTDYWFNSLISSLHIKISLCATCWLRKERYKPEHSHSIK